MSASSSDQAPSLIDRMLGRAGQLLGIGLLGLLALYLAGAFFALSGTRSLEYGEPFIVSAAWNLSQGGSLYAPVASEPFLHNNYNPLVQTMLAPILAVTGPHPGPGRAATVLAFLVLLGLLVRVARRQGVPLEIAVLAGLLPLGAGFLFPWMVLGRVDVVATAFSVAAATVGLATERFTWRQWLLVLVLAWLAFLCKQSVVGGMGAVLLARALRGGWGPAIGIGLIFTAGCAALLGILQLLTDGQHWLHAVVYNASHDRGALWPEALPPARIPEVFGLPLVILLVWAPLFVRPRRDLAWICWPLVAFPLALLLVRKSGSHVHYLLESVCALSLLMAIGVGRTLAEADAHAHRGRLRLVGIVLLLAAIMTLPVARQHVGKVGWLRLEATHDAGLPAEVVERVRDGDGPSLLLGKTATLALEQGRAAIFDIADFARLIELERFDPEERLLPLVRARAFPVIAEQVFPPEHPGMRHFSVEAIPGLREAMDAHYRVLDFRWSHPKGLLEARIHVPRER